MGLKAFNLTVALVLCALSSQAQQVSYTDLWDVSQGVSIITNSPLWSEHGPERPFDARDVFGGEFSTASPDEIGCVLFGDVQSTSTVHFVEWRTTTPVTVRSFNLWASGDGIEYGSRREFANIKLKAKNPGSTEFGELLYSFSPSHPYTFVAGTPLLLISSDVKPITAQEFRIEIISRTAELNNGPRLIELDGFDEFVGPCASIRASEVEITWPSVLNLVYQVEYRSSLTGGQWMALGSPIIGNGSTNRVSDAVSQELKLYRVRSIQ